MTTKPEYVKMPRRKLKKIPAVMEHCVASNIKAILHAHRDELRNQEKDTRVVRFSCHSGYYGEAFGILRMLDIQGYGYLGPTNLSGLEDHSGAEQPHQNLTWWLAELEREVLDEENFRGDGTCAHCKEKYQKDDASYFKRLRAVSGGEPVFVHGTFYRPERG
jgi:hypothetical protein